MDRAAEKDIPLEELINSLLRREIEIIESVKKSLGADHAKVTAGGRRYGLLGSG